MKLIKPTTVVIMNLSCDELLKGVLKKNNNLAKNNYNTFDILKLLGVLMGVIVSLSLGEQVILLRDLYSIMIRIN